MVELADSFETNAEDVTIAVGMRKDDARITQVNEVLATISEEEQIALMDDMIENQPVEEASEGETPSFFAQVWNIVVNNWQQLLRGTGMTLLISILGTIIGTAIGLLIGVFRTAPKQQIRRLLLVKSTRLDYQYLHRNFPWYADDCTIHGYLLWYRPSIRTQS